MYFKTQVPCFSIKELKDRTHLHLVMSWIQIEFNHIWNRRPHSHDSSIRIAVLIFHFHGSCARIKVEKRTSLFAWAFLSLVMHARYKKFNPTGVKGYNVQLIRCENDTAWVHPSIVIPWAVNRILSNSVQEIIHVLPITYVDTCDKSYEIVFFFSTYMIMINSRHMTKISYDYANTKIWRTMNKEINWTDMSPCNWILLL